MPHTIGRYLPIVRSAVGAQLLIVGRGHLEQVLRVYVQHWSRTKQLVEPTAALPLAACAPARFAATASAWSCPAANLDAAALAACLAPPGQR
ncbi:MAG TPA: hypothetical protein VG276_21505 [Actinomycetes bacterium]|nr:hypothetical protein [Actinomycetes bacterium]